MSVATLRGDTAGHGPQPRHTLVAPGYVWRPCGATRRDATRTGATRDGGRRGEGGRRWEGMGTHDRTSPGV